MLGTLATGFYLGLKTDKSAIVNLSSNPISSLVSFVKPTISVKSTPVVSTPSSTPAEAERTTDRYTISGGTNISQYKVEYNLSFPKKGGDVEGSVSGFCNGNITGTVEPPFSDRLSKFKGNLVAKCNSSVIFLFKTDMKADLEGTVDYKSGKVQIIYVFSEPFELRGSTDLNFTP